MLMLDRGEKRGSENTLGGVLRELVKERSEKWEMFESSVAKK